MALIGTGQRNCLQLESDLILDDSAVPPTAEKLRSRKQTLTWRRHENILGVCHVLLLYFGVNSTLKCCAVGLNCTQR